MPGGDHGDIELWLVDLARSWMLLDAIEGRAAVLTGDDRQRAEAISDATLRRERRATYIALRVLLERRLGLTTRGVAIVRTPAGKPALAGLPIAFSLAHADGVALIALGAREPIGVDIEVERRAAIAEPRRDGMLAAARGLAGAELAAGLAPEAMQLSAWVRLEAFAKATGDGVARLLGSLGLFGVERALAPSLVVIEQRATRLAEMHAIAVSDIAGVIGAVAVARGLTVPALQHFPTDWTAWRALCAVDG